MREFIQRCWSVIWTRNRRGQGEMSKSSVASQPAETLYFLTPKQRQLIVKSWGKISDKRAFCQRIYMHVFVLQPRLQKLFSFAGKQTHDLLDDTGFNKQAQIFCTFLEKIVANVSKNNASRLKAECLWAGARHATLPTLKFDPQWWQVFVTAFLNCLQPFCKSSQPVMDAWGVLMHQVVTIMEEGFVSAKKDEEFGRNVDVISGEEEDTCTGLKTRTKTM